MKTILIQNGTVYDGLGNPGRKADVLLADGKVAAIADRITQSADITIDAAGNSAKVEGVFCFCKRCVVRCGGYRANTDLKF